VERLRQGRSYATQAVKAIQNGRIIFVLICSFQKPEPWQPSHQWPIPAVPTPEECELEEVRYHRLSLDESINPRLKKVYQEFVAVRRRGFVVTTAY